MDKYLNGIRDELNTVKTNEDFYHRLDALVTQLSKLCPNAGEIKDQKSADVMTSLVFLLREGDDKGFNIVVRCEIKPIGGGVKNAGENVTQPNVTQSAGGNVMQSGRKKVMNAYMSYMQSPFGRVYSFYTTMEKAEKAVGNDNWAELPVQFVMNNLFNRKEAVAFTFNGEFGKSEGIIIVPLMFLRPVFQGKMPKPENFRE